VIIISKFLLLLGVSGVGKSTLIEELKRLDKRFVYISPYMTRAIREGELDKIAISNEEMNSMISSGEFIVVNELYGMRYGTPSRPVLKALEDNFFPVLDWPIDQLSIMRNYLPNQVYAVYVSPPSIEELKRRLGKDKRDVGGKRLKAAIDELNRFKSGEFSELYDLDIIFNTSSQLKTAKLIYVKYLEAIKK
jgi:guanylate kinase